MDTTQGLWTTKKINDHGLGTLKVAVNLSALQFNDEYIVETVRGILDETGMSPEFLDLEITESIAMNNATSASEKFKKWMTSLSLCLLMILVQDILV